MRISAVAGLPEGLAALRAEARREGSRSLERLASEWEAGATRFDRAGEALLAAHGAGVLAGIGGLTPDPVVPDALRTARRLPRATSPASMGMG